MMINDELKEINIKNHTCSYFDGIINFEDFDLNNILIDEKSYKNILIYNISDKTLLGAKSFRIRFDKIDGFIRVYDGTRYSRYLILLGAGKYDFIYKRIEYCIGVKSGITYAISPSYAKIKVGSYDSLPLEKTLALHNVIIPIKSVFNKDKNNYYCNIFV